MKGAAAKRRRTGRHVAEAHEGALASMKGAAAKRRRPTDWPAFTGWGEPQ